MPPWQLRQRLLQSAHHLVGFNLHRGLRGIIGRLLQRIAAFIVLPVPRNPRHNALAHDAPALHVADPILQDAIEQRLPFLGGTRGVAVCQLHHRVLHRIEGVRLMPQCYLCDPKPLALDPG